MDINRPFISYYPRDDSKYIDPMFVPYGRDKLPINGTSLDGGSCKLEINTWKPMGNPNYVHPDHYRRGWNWDFMKIHPNDPCPGGFKDVGNGMCTRIEEEEHQSNFYTSKQFKVKYQYPDGYAVSPLPSVGVREKKIKSIDDGPSFKGGSINPYTGNWVVYHTPKPNPNELKYSGLPSRYSYLGF